MKNKSQILIAALLMLTSVPAFADQSVGHKAATNIDFNQLLESVANEKTVQHEEFKRVVAERPDMGRAVASEEPARLAGSEVTNTAVPVAQSER